jgi:iron(III) transport system permease protein
VNRVVVTFAIALLVLLVLAPVATMFVESLRVDVVTTKDGARYLGDIRDRGDNGITMRVHGEKVSRLVKPEETASVGRAWSTLNYADVLSGVSRRNMLLATLALAGASTLLAFIVGLPLGVLFAATDLPGRRSLELLAALPLVMPPVLLAIAMYHDLLSVRPEFLRAVLVFGLSLFPMVSLFTARAIRATGAEALEAARVQTTPREALLRVAVGPALPGAAAGALLVFAFVVADFAVPDFLGVTTAKNTITVYANAVFRAWTNDADAGVATAAGMPATLLAIAAFAVVLVLEARREAATVGSGFRELEPLPLGRRKWIAGGLVAVLLLVVLVLPLYRHLETAAGKHFGKPVAIAAPGVPVDVSRAKPKSLLDGLRKGLHHDRVAESSINSLLLAGGGALVAVLLALLLAEAGRNRPKLDRVLLVAAFLPVAVPPMSLAVGWVEFFGPTRAAGRYFPILLMGARLLPFAMFAVRATRRRVAPEMLEAGAMAGLPPAARMLRISLLLSLPGASLGFLLAFLFGLREVDALVFTRTGAETLPVQLYNMIHYGYDVQVAGLAFLWTAAVALFLLLIRLVVGSRFRLLP